MLELFKNTTCQIEGHFGLLSHLCTNVLIDLVLQTFSENSQFQIRAVCEQLISIVKQYLILRSFALTASYLTHITTYS